METPQNSPQKNNKKWVVFAGITAILALAFAVGPIFMARYMRNQYLRNLRVQTTPIMIKVRGTIQTYGDTVYLFGDNFRTYHLLGDKLDELKRNAGSIATVVGDMATPQVPTIGGRPVRLTIYVTDFGMPDLPAMSTLTDEDMARLQQRANERLEFRHKILTEINRADQEIRYDIIVGNVVREMRYVAEDFQRPYFVLTDQWGDRFVLAAAGGFFGFPENAKLIAIGRVAMPASNHPIHRDEVMFVVNELYQRYPLTPIF